MGKSWIEEQADKDPVFRKEIAGERLMLVAAVAIEDAMRRRTLSRAGLARAIGATDAYVTRLLRGENLTLKTCAKIAEAVKHRVVFFMIPEADYESTMAYVAKSGTLAPPEADDAAPTAHAAAARPAPILKPGTVRIHRHGVRQPKTEKAGPKMRPHGPRHTPRQPKTV